MRQQSAIFKLPLCGAEACQSLCANSTEMGYAYEPLAYGAALYFVAKHARRLFS